jgi:hypothetical protein
MCVCVRACVRVCVCVRVCANGYKKVQFDQERNKYIEHTELSCGS